MLKVRDLSVGYGNKVVLKGINFELSGGECVLLCGANGCGKSTLMKTIAGMVKPLGGELNANGSVILVPTGIPKVKGFTLREFVQTACYRETDIWGRADKETEKAIDEAISTLGISELASCDISEISDGEFQKACIATALARKAGVMLFDEPTSFLDVDSRATVLECLRDIAKEKNLSVLFSSHDIHESAAVCSRIFGISRSRYFLDSATSSKEEVLNQCFTSRLKLSL